MDYASLQPIPIPGQEFMDRSKWDRIIALDNATGVPFGCKIGYGFWGREQPMSFVLRSKTQCGPNYTGFQGVIIRSSYWVTPGSGTDSMDHDPRPVDQGGDVTLLGYGKNITPRRIKDGLSKTGIIAEKHVRLRNYAIEYSASDDRGWSTVGTWILRQLRFARH